MTASATVSSGARRCYIAARGHGNQEDRRARRPPGEDRRRRAAARGRAPDAEVQALVDRARRGLTKVRATKGYARWGFEDFYDYCSRELTLKRATVDKLTISYNTIQTHAPEVLEWDGVAKAIPSYDAVDYFSRAVGARQRSRAEGDERRARQGSASPQAQPRDPELVREMKSAVFDEGQPVAELRKRFDPSSTRGPRAPTASSCSPRPPPAPASSPSCSPTSRASRRSASASSRRSSAPCVRTSSGLAEPLREQVARAQKRLQKPPKRAGRAGGLGVQRVAWRRATRAARPRRGLARSACARSCTRARESAVLRTIRLASGELAWNRAPTSKRALILDASSGRLDR
jgi:hypothetical protein